MMTHTNDQQVVLESEDVRGLAEFYRQMFGFTYLERHEPPPPGEPARRVRTAGAAQLRRRGRVAFQQVDQLPRSPVPDPTDPADAALDTSVPDVEELHRQHDRVLGLGGKCSMTRSEDEQRPLFVYADPAGHPFLRLRWPLICRLT